MSESHEKPTQEESERRDEEHAERPVPGDSPGGQRDDVYPDSDWEKVSPLPGGYDGRDPATDMPRVPAAPETQDE